MYNRLHIIPACDRQTDGRTDILPRHSPRYAYASRGKNQLTGCQNGVLIKAGCLPTASHTYLLTHKHLPTNHLMCISMCSRFCS